MSELPDLEAWAIFARVAELRSFSAAAQALGLSNATVSKAVSRLEQRLGIKLFHRTTRTLSLTTAGQSLVGRAAALLSDAEEAEEAARAESSGPRGVVRIAAPMGFGMSHVADALPDLMRRCPELVLDLRLSDTVIDLVEDGVDLGLRIGSLEDSSMMVRRLRPIPTYLVASPSYLKQHGPPQAPRDLETHACFSYSNAARPGRWRLTHRDGEEITVSPRSPLSVNSGEAMLPALRAGLGIALLPEFIVAADVTAGSLVHLLPDWSAPPAALHLLMPSAGPRPARVSAVIDFFVERFGQAK